MIDEIKDHVQSRAEESVNGFIKSLSTIPADFAHTRLLSEVSIEYYGVVAPLHELAEVVAEDRNTLRITVLDDEMVPLVEKAIVESPLGLSPVSTCAMIRLPVPPLTEARRKDLRIIIRGRAESARMNIRSAHKDASSVLSVFSTDGVISMDEYRSGAEEVQKIADAAIAQVNDALAEKEKELGIA